MSGTKEELLFAARISDLVRAAQTGGAPKFSDFLNPSQRKAAQDISKNCGIVPRFFGGYDEAERVVACFSDFDTDFSKFPICALRISVGGYRELSHRDYLGSILSLGVTREVLGDILPEREGAFVFANRKIAPFLCDSLTKIGGDGAKAEVLDEMPQLCGVRSFLRESGVIASARLDCVVGTLAKKARGRATELIEGGLVLLSGLSAKKDSKVREGDIISIRGVGKFRIISLAGRSKKDNIIMEYDRYA